MYSLMETFKQCKIIPGQLPVSQTRDPVNKNFLKTPSSGVFRRFYTTLSSTLFPAESCLVSDELLQYRHFVSKQQFDKDLTDEQEEEVLAQFVSLDPDRKGQIEWSDFLYFESLAVLTKLRTEVAFWNKDART